jgi:hypothetical protein
MKILGIALRTPNATELTAAAVMGSGLWVALIGLLRAAAVQIDRFDAGALLLVIVWGAVSARLGIRIGHGHRHLLANLAISAGLLALYQGAWALSG